MNHMMNLNFKHVLVTGGAGFIGSHLVEALVAEGCDVRVIDDLSTGRMTNLSAVKNKITFYRGDILDPSLLEDAISGCEAVFHLAAVVSVPWTVDHPVDSAMINEIGTLHTLEASRRQGVRRFVSASSCAVYGDSRQNPKRETMVPNPLSPYAVQKLAGEHYVRIFSELHGLDAIALRYFNVYGPRQDPSSPYSGVISIFINRALSGNQPVIYGDGYQSRDFIYVKDVVRANLLAATVNTAGRRTFNVGTGTSTHINGLWKEIQKLSGSETVPVYEPLRPGEIRESVADTGLAVSRLGFQTVFQLTEGLARTYEWYRRQTTAPSAETSLCDEIS